MAIVLFILVFIVCAVCMKKKKTDDKIVPMTVKLNKIRKIVGVAVDE